MQGRKHEPEKLLTHCLLSSPITEDNCYRRLKEMLDLTFLNEHTKDGYGITGNPSIDPLAFFMLIGYLEHITSERNLIKHCTMRPRWRTVGLGVFPG